MKIMMMADASWVHVAASHTHHLQRNNTLISFMHAIEDVQIPRGIIVLLFTNVCVPSL